MEDGAYDRPECLNGVLARATRAAAVRVAGLVGLGGAVTDGHELHALETVPGVELVEKVERRQLGRGETGHRLGENDDAGVVHVTATARRAAADPLRPPK